MLHNNRTHAYLILLLCISLLVVFYNNWNLNLANEELNVKLRSLEEKNFMLLQKKDNLEKLNSENMNDIKKIQQKVEDYSQLVERKEDEISNNKQIYETNLERLERQENEDKQSILNKLNETDQSSKVFEEENVKLKVEIDQLKELVYDLELKKKHQEHPVENNVKSTVELEKSKKGRMVDLPTPSDIIGNETLENLKKSDSLTQTIDNLEENVSTEPSVEKDALVTENSLNIEEHTKETINSVEATDPVENEATQEELEDQQQIEEGN